MNEELRKHLLKALEFSENNVRILTEDSKNYTARLIGSSQNQTNKILKEIIKYMAFKSD